MPVITVYFDPDKISQETIDELKGQLRPMTAMVLSSLLSCTAAERESYGHDDILEIQLRVDDDEIMVFQHATHPTDLSPPLSIRIEAGLAKYRNPSLVVKWLAKLISESKIVGDEHLGNNNSNIIVRFHDKNGFDFILKPKKDE